MFAKPPGKNRAMSRDRAALDRLGAALADLPAPWTVLASRRPSGEDGPPWVKYIAFHPRKGIALIDLVPAEPDTAVAPLEEFLARTGFAAFSRGDPPIIAVALAEEDFPTLADCLESVFAAAPRCSIKNANWPEAVTELLMGTPDLLLTRLESGTKAASAPAAPPLPREQVPLRSTPPKRTPASEPEARPRGVEGLRAEPIFRSSSAGRSEPARSAEPLDHSESRERREPAFRSEPEYRREPRLSASRTTTPSGEPKALLDDDGYRPFERRPARNRPVVLWVIAASLAVTAVSLSGLAAVKIFSSHSPAASSTTASSAPPASPAAANDILPDLAKAPPIATKTVPTENEMAAKNPPATPAPPVRHSPSASAQTPTPSTAAKPTAPAAKAMVAQEAPSPPAAPKEAAPIPSHKPAAPPLETKQVAAPPQPHMAISLPPSPTELAHAKRPTKHGGNPGDLSGYSYVKPGNTVTINGTTYVAGQEPHNLGTITVPVPQTNTDPPAYAAPARPSPAPSASAGPATSPPQTRYVLCADPLHQDRPGGSDYHGPPVPGCPSVP